MKISSLAEWLTQVHWHCVQKVGLGMKCLKLKQSTVCKQNGVSFISQLKIDHTSQLSWKEYCYFCKRLRWPVRDKNTSLHSNRKLCDAYRIWSSIFGFLVLDIFVHWHNCLPWLYLEKDVTDNKIHKMEDALVIKCYKSHVLDWIHISGLISSFSTDLLFWTDSPYWPFTDSSDSLLTLYLLSTDSLLTLYWLPVDSLLTLN